MSGNEQEVEFERVLDPEVHEPGSEPAAPTPEQASPAPEALEGNVDRLDPGRFPLAGPIVEEGTRELKGRCSKCDSRLRVRVRSRGAVRVRCPICGNVRRIEL